VPRNKSILLPLRKPAPAAPWLGELAEALAFCLNRSAPEVAAWLAEYVPGSNPRILQADYGSNAELWESFCGYALNLAGFDPASSPTKDNSLSTTSPSWRGRRKVSVEEQARIVVLLFWFTLLISHGCFAPEIDLTQWEKAPERSRQRAFRFLWGTLHRAAALGDNTNSAPTRRAAYEIASLLVPGIARTYERDRKTLEQFERRWRQRSRLRSTRENVGE